MADVAKVGVGGRAYSADVALMLMLQSYSDRPPADLIFLNSSGPVPWIPADLYPTLPL